MRVIITRSAAELEQDIKSFRRCSSDSVLVIKNYASKNIVRSIRNLYETVQLPGRKGLTISDDTESFFVQSDESHERKLAQVMARAQFMLFKEGTSSYIFRLSASIMKLRDHICELESSKPLSSAPSSGQYYMSTICHYPSGGGRLEAHKDPYDKVGGSVHGILLLTTRGEDFKEGGLIVRSTMSDMACDIENYAAAGDLVLFDPYSNYHEVTAIDCSEAREWDKSRGRCSLSCVRVSTMVG